MATKKAAKTAAEPVLTAAERRKKRAAEIKESNRKRLEILAQRKAEKKAAKEAAKAGKAEPDPAKLAKAAAAKEAREAKEKKAAEAAKLLNPIAKEVNVRLEKAAKMEKDADDHRLAAALQLKTAEEKCKEGGLNFKAWSEEHVKGQSYETVRKLLAVGKADDPVLALEDMRAKNAAANKKLREKQKAQRTAPPRSSAGEGSDVTRSAEADEMLEGLDALKTAFGELRASEQMEFVDWAANQVGAKLDTSM